MKVLSAAAVPILALLHSFKWSMAQTQPAPDLHYDKSYTIVGKDGSDIVVTPATVYYNYELYDGQMIFTHTATDKIPGFDFEYAQLALSNVRNIHRETKEPVSLDEVYFHHFSLYPFGMTGAELLTYSEEMPYMKFADGYGFIVRKDRDFHVNAHLLSNVDLEPIDGSLALAKKECNECYYAKGKGSDCTPELSGTFLCCGDSLACTTGDEGCYCQTNSPIDTSKTTKYQIQVELLISKEVEKFQHVDLWTISAPACSTLKQYPADDFCSPDHMEGARGAGQGSFFHQIEGNNEEPEVKTKIDVLAPDGGVLTWMIAHIHSGARSASLLINDQVICVSDAVYGNNSDMTTNAYNEQNHLVHITPCFMDSVIRFEQGDKLTVESIYYAGEDDANFKGFGAGGEHKNVMSFFGLGTAFDGKKDSNDYSSPLFNNFDSRHYYGGLNGISTTEVSASNTHLYQLLAAFFALSTFVLTFVVFPKSPTYCTKSDSVGYSTVGDIEVSM